jgi:hypothetical protein
MKKKSVINANQPKVILLDNVADVIKYFKGELPDLLKAKEEILKDYNKTHKPLDIRMKPEVYLRALELMEIAKHIF